MFERREQISKNTLFDGVDEIFQNASEFMSIFMNDFFIPADVIETNEKTIIRMELPGLEKKDIQIYLKDGDLVIAGEKKEPADNGNISTILKHQIKYGKFAKTYTLKDTSIASKIEAEFNNGVLSVAIPKTNASNNTASIPIK